MDKNQKGNNTNTTTKINKNDEINKSNKINNKTTQNQPVIY